VTADHVHNDFDSPSAWSIKKLRLHLLYGHSVAVPVTWDIGQLHQAHLDEHAGPVQANLGTLSPDLPPLKGPFPVPDTHTHSGDLPGFHARTDRRQLAYHLELSHKLDPGDIDVREVYSQHEILHSPQDPATDAERVERLAENLYNRDARGTGPDWDDLGQETRDQYRDRARTNLAAERDARMIGEAAAERAKQTIGSEMALQDRLVCAMTGLDFDQDWTADSGIGPNARGALRKAHGDTAARLLNWLERGGALHLPAVASLAEDVATLREQLTATGQQLESTQRERDHLSRQLSDALLERNAVYQRLDTAVATRDKALEAGRLLENARDDAQEKLEACQEDYRRICRVKQDAQDELRWLRASRAKESMSTDLNALAPLSPDQAACSDELPQINQPFKGLTLEVPPGTDRLMLSFVREDPDMEDKPSQLRGI
jgi:hypothetical protein